MSYKINMTRILNVMERFKGDESGATAIEYGLTASLIGVLLITGAGAVGGSIRDTLTQISFALDGPLELPVSSIRSGP